MSLFVGTRVEVVAHGHVIHYQNRRWRVRDDYPVVVGDTTYTTEEGYQDTLKTLAYMGHVGSRYRQ